MAWILRRITFTLKMGLALTCILCLGFALSVPNNQQLGPRTNLPTSKPIPEPLPVFYLSFQPYALPAAFASLPSGPQKHELGKLMLRYGAEKEWIDWFRHAHFEGALPSPEILAQLYETPELAHNLSFLPNALKHLKVRHLPWYSYLPKCSFHAHNRFQLWLFGGSAQQKGLIRADLGFSKSNGLAVWNLVLDSTSITLRFSMPAMLLGFLLGLLLALIAVQYRLPSTPFLLLSIVPSFIMGALVFLVFDWGGSSTPALAKDLDILSFISAYKLPALTLTLINAAIYAAHMQVWIQAETERLFFQTALAKGLVPFKALGIHALRAALKLILTFTVQRLPLLISGTVVIEVMFGVPGFGRLAWLAVLEKDQPLVLGCLLFSAVLAWISVYLNAFLSKYSTSFR